MIYEKPLLYDLKSGANAEGFSCSSGWWVDSQCNSGGGAGAGSCTYGSSEIACTGGGAAKSCDGGSGADYTNCESGTKASTHCNNGAGAGSSCSTGSST
jgi:hypothetical protein